MTIFEAIILGLVQGLTEFLPISSSGHLVLIRSFIEIKASNDIAFEVFVHFGTFLSVTAVFWRDILSITKEFLNVIRHPLSVNSLYKNSEEFRLGIFIIVGCIPAGIVGVFFRESIEALFSSGKLTSLMLIMTGLILYITRFAKVLNSGNLSLVSSIGIGMAQAFAILPGISRSGATISTGLILGIKKELAARFSLLMSLPVILGATILKVYDLYLYPPNASLILAFTFGAIVAFISGYIAIRFLLDVLRKGKFLYFSYYCLIVGILGLLFLN